jgi:hypothetical protein
MPGRSFPVMTGRYRMVQNPFEIQKYARQVVYDTACLKSSTTVKLARTLFLVTICKREGLRECGEYVVRVCRCIHSKNTHEKYTIQHASKHLPTVKLGHYYFLWPFCKRKGLREWYVRVHVLIFPRITKKWFSVRIKQGVRKSWYFQEPRATCEHCLLLAEGTTLPLVLSTRSQFCTVPCILRTVNLRFMDLAVLLFSFFPGESYYRGEC